MLHALECRQFLNASEEAGDVKKVIERAKAVA